MQVRPGWAQKNEICYTVTEIVALVLPLDSFKGAARNTGSPSLMYGWGRSESAISLKKKKVCKQ
jgi:hypothetical protein